MAIKIKRIPPAVYKNKPENSLSKNNSGVSKWSEPSSANANSNIFGNNSNLVSEKIFKNLSKTSGFLIFKNNR